MRIKGFCLGPSLFSSPNWFESGNLHVSSHAPLLFLTVCRHFRTKSVSNCDSREKMYHDLGNINSLKDALNVYENMSKMNPFPSVKAFNQLLSRVVNLKEYCAAISLFKDICILGIPINEYTMNVAINSYCLSNGVSCGFAILGLFFKRGIVPNTVTFSTLLKGLFLENRIEEAQELFRKIVREELCELNVITYGTVIDGLCKAGNTTLAVKLLRVMEKGSCKPNTHIYNMVLDSLCKDGKVDYALKLKPNFYTYCNFFDGLCKNGHVGQAFSMLNVLEEKGDHLHLNHYNIVMNGLCKTGKLGIAQDVFNDIRAKGLEPDVVTYTILIKGYCQNGLLEEAKDVLKKMESASVLPDVITYNTIVQGALISGQYDDASKFIKEMDARGISIDSYTLALLLELLGTTINPTIFNIFKMLAPNTLKRKL